MIKLSELRKGNLVTSAHETNSPILTVERIESEGIKTQRGYKIESLLLPITLNEEWLTMFGFMLESVSKIKYTDGISRTDKIYSLHLNSGILSVLVVMNYEETEVRNIRFSQSVSNWAPELKYVHKFQNLAFELTNEELEYREQESHV